MQNVILTPNLQHWLYWIGAFAVVAVVLAIGAFIQDRMGK